MSKRKLNFASNPMPLRGSKDKKQVDKKSTGVFIGLGQPLKPTPMFSDKDGKPVDLGLKLRLSQKADNSGNKVKVKQNDLSNEFSTSTTTTPSTTSTTPGDTASSSTSSKGTTQSTKPNTGFKTTNTIAETSMAKKQNKYNNNSSSSDDFRNKRPDPIGFNGGEVSGADQFRLSNDDGSNIGALYGDGERKKVEFPLKLICTNYLNDFETSDISGSELRPKVILKATTFSGQMANAKTSPLDNVDYNQTLNLIFKKFDSDVANTLNSYTAPNWTFSNFADGLTDICKALEYYYFLDAVLAHDPGSMGTDNVNRCYQQYKGVFTNNQALIANRATLRSYLKGCWFPPNFAQLIRYFYQTYKVNPLEQSAVIRYIPDTCFFISDTTKDSFLSSPNLATVIDNLKPGSNAAKISAILNKVYQKGRMTSFPKSCSDIVYDVLMTEITMNEPYGFSDILSSNAQSVYPMSYQSSGNDIPYYMDANPNSSLNGLAYAMQTIPTAKTATTGYVQTYYSGIRAPLYSSIKDKNNNINKTNVQVLTNANGELFGKSRNLISTGSVVDIYQANNVIFSYAQNSATTSLVVSSQAPANMQRVYFNNYNGPRLLMTELINNLFQTRA